MPEPARGLWTARNRTDSLRAMSGSISLPPASSPLGHARALLVLGLPIIGSNLAQVGLHTVDTVMMGWYGVRELAAVVLAAGLFFVLFVVGSGVSYALMGRVAASLGAGDETQVRRDTRMALWLSLGYAAAIQPVLFQSGALLRLMGQEDDIADLAQQFLRVSMIGMFPALTVAVVKSCLSAFERTRVVLAVTLIGVGINIALNWVLIFGRYGFPELGLRGAAVSSVVVQLVTAAALVGYAARQPQMRRFGLFQRLWRPDWEAARTMARLGVPIGLTALAESGLFQATALMMGWIGAVPLAAHGIAMELAMLTFMVHMGLSSAATVRAGRAFGRHDRAALRMGAWVAQALSLCFGAVVVAAFLLIPGPLVALFLDPAKPEAPEIMAVGIALLAVAGLFQLFDATQVMALGLLRGVQDTRVPMWVAVTCYWGIGLPASYLLGFTFGGGAQGIWLGLVVGLACTGLTLIVRFWRGPWCVAR